MNSLETLVREYAYTGHGNRETMIICIVVVALLTLLFAINSDGWLIVFLWLISGVLFFVFFSKSEQSIDLKKEYNAILEEKQNKIELIYYRKDKASENARNKFKVVFTKDNEENYYIYFDEKADEKKTTSFKEIQQFVKNQVDYEYYEALDNFKIKDLSKSKRKQKEESVDNETDKTTVDELQKQLDELKKKENTKKEVSEKETNTEQLQRELNELKKKIDKKNTEE